MRGPDETVRLEPASGPGEPRLGAVLVVEDDEETRELMRDVLEGAGFQVAEAGDGKEALALLGGGLHPSLIFLDLMMPVMNGFEFLEELRCDPANAATPVVIVTAWAEQAATIQGAQGLLEKPFALEELFQCVRRYVTPGEPSS